jgi:hypothetical protein
MEAWTEQEVEAVRERARRERDLALAQPPPESSGIWFSIAALCVLALVLAALIVVIRLSA